MIVLQTKTVPSTRFCAPHVAHRSARCSYTSPNNRWRVAAKNAFEKPPARTSLTTICHRNIVQVAVVVSADGAVDVDDDGDDNSPSSTTITTTTEATTSVASSGIGTLLYTGRALLLDLSDVR